MRLIIFLSILFFSCGQNHIDYKIIVDSNDQILTKNSNIKLSLSEVVSEGESSVNFFLNDSDKVRLNKIILSKKKTEKYTIFNHYCHIKFGKSN